jgi:hypothetical protein
MSSAEATSTHFSLTWLHLSDIHFGAGGPYIKMERDDILAALLDDIDRMREVVPIIDQVIVSGDVAFSGGSLSRDEYEDATQFLTRLGTSLGLANDAILVVPGNHDVDRAVAKDDDVRRWLDELRLHGRPIDEALAGDRDRIRFSFRMGGYLRFAQGFGECVGTGGSVGLGHWTTVVEAHGDLRVRISGGNTALLSQGDDDYQKLQLGLAQLRDVRITSDDHDVLVLVTHHPLDWLRDREVVEPRVRRSADIHLYGHVHEADSERITRGAGGGIVRVVAGAVHEHDGQIGRGRYGYSIGSIFMGAGHELGLRIWPRMWTPRNAEFRTDVASVADGQIHTDHAVGGRNEAKRRSHSRRVGTTTNDNPAPATQAGLWAASDRSARRLGTRRTAYPLDLSIAELHERGVYVPATFTDPAGQGERIDVDRLADQIMSRKSALILGEPGSGKSVAAYALLQRLRQYAPAVAIRVSELPDAIDGDPARTDLALALRGSADGNARPILLIDGLDETLAEFDSSAELFNLINRLRVAFTLIITCRRREFEDQLAGTLGGDTFDSIVSIESWSVDRQFSDFVNRLVLGRFLESDEILSVVKSSSTLALMASRPLFARMLTFLGQSSVETVANVSTLYAEYIDKLSLASDSALVGAGCRLPVPSRRVWTEAAWSIFAKALLTEERFSARAVTSLVAAKMDASPSCVARALGQICDEWRIAGRVWGRFVHYSFFEYLVACHYLREVVEAVMKGSTDRLAESLALDLTPEIRHFLVDELRDAGIPDMSSALEGAYKASKRFGRGSVRARTIGNLIAYLLSRAAADAKASLRRLADEEEDMFLQQSLLWGLCHVGDDQALEQFVTASRISATWREWNRGYLMYYYGDIDRKTDPPFVDSDPRRPWGRTRERSIALMTGETYSSAVTAQRRYLDLYTLYEYAIWRGIVLTIDEAAVAARTLVNLWTDSAVGGELLLELQAMHAAACPNPVEAP